MKRRAARKDDGFDDARRLLDFETRERRATPGPDTLWSDSSALDPWGDLL